MDANTAIAVCALVIALASLWVSYTETRAVRLHNRQSVRPILQIRRSRNYEGDKAGLRIINTGLGPAIITKTILFLDGEMVGEWDFQTHERVKKLLPIRPKSFSLRGGMQLPVGHDGYFLLLENFDEVEHAWFWEYITRRFHIEIYYESLYGGEGFKVETPHI